MEWSYLQQHLPGKGEGLAFQRKEQVRKEFRGSDSMPPRPAWVMQLRLHAKPHRTTL
jgi:hypothetical protein